MPASLHAYLRPSEPLERFSGVVVTLTPAEALRRVAGPLRAIARYAPTTRLALLIAIAAPIWIFSSTVTGQTVATTLLALIVIAALADALRIPGGRYVALSRIFPPNVGVGDTREARYEINSSWPARLGVAVTQQLPASLLAVAPDTFAPDIEPFQPRSFPVSITGRTRGTFPLGPVALTILGPWKLVRRSIIYSLNDTISIIPSIVGAGRYRLLAAQYRLRTAGQRMIRRRGAGTSFANLRDYVSGDDPRRIDWK
ncbi:MAG TPA: DUF58 domain-containing protein, partial [Gemmatimonadaceae bacterium]